MPTPWLQGDREESKRGPRGAASPAVPGPRRSIGELKTPRRLHPPTHGLCGGLQWGAVAHPWEAVNAVALGTCNEEEGP